MKDSPTFSLFTAMAFAFNSLLASPFEERKPVLEASASIIDSSVPKSSRLMVACLYTRSGGLDINPIRATHRDMIPPMFIDVNYRNKKTLRQ